MKKVVTFSFSLLSIYIILGSVMTCYAYNRVSVVNNRNDGTWLFPAPSQYYDSFSDWAGCPGTGICGFHNYAHSGAHGGDNWGDDSHTWQAPIGHNGIDISMGDGTEVYAAASGTVVYAFEYDASRGSYVILEHPIIGTGYSYYSYYQHLSAIAVRTGSTVNAGQKIAYSGHTGSGCGPHLHFGIVMAESGTNISSRLYSIECNGWLDGSGYTEKSVLTNPSVTSIFPQHSDFNDNVLAPLAAHSGSVKYTFNINEVTVGCSHSAGYKTIQKSDGSYVAVCKECGTEYLLPTVNTADAGIYKTTADIHLNSAPYQEAQVGNEIKKGASYTIIGSVLNAYGNKWYKTDGGYWIYKDYMTKTGEISSSFDCTLTSPSGTIQAASPCDVIGSVTSARTITDITAWVSNVSGETIISKSCNPGGNSYSFYGSEIDRGLKFQNITKNGQYYFKVTISDDRSCSRVFTFPFTVTGGTGDVASLDLNGHLDGEKAWSIEGYGTVDVYVNGSPVADNVSDYCTTWPVGTTYEFKDFKPFSGYSYNGVYAGSRTGTVGSDGVSFEPDFTTINTASLTEMPTRSTFNGHTYLYYATPVTWYFAKEFCEEQGGHLVTITSAEENAFVWSLCDSQLAWFGGSDQDSEGSWKWVTNEPFSYSNWYSGEPNNCAGTGDYENFAHFSGAKNGQWNDTVGYDSHPFVCEIDSIPSGSTHAEIPSGMSALYKREIDGINVGRDANQLIVYTNSGQTVNTNSYGLEVAVDSEGKVSAVRSYDVDTQLVVPNGGFVLSGHIYQENSGGIFVEHIIDAGDVRVVVNYEDNCAIVYGYPQISTESDDQVRFTSGNTRMNCGGTDDTYEIVMGLTNTATILEYGISCKDSKGNEVVKEDSFKYAPQGVDMSAGNHNCIFCLYTIHSDGTEHGNLIVGETYTWSGYAICEGIRFTSPTYSFKFSKEGSRFIIPVTGVSLNKTSLTLNVGASETLTATVSPSNATNKSVTWTTSNASVATVSNGKIIAVGAGTATITVTTADGNKTAACAVTVKIPVTGVSLNKTSLTLNAGASETLTATVSPSNATNKAVTWMTSNASVATVSNGTVSAVGAGTATITVTTADGNKTATCTVTVKIPVTGVSLNKTALTLTAGSSETLTATVNPSNASNKSVTWTTSNSSVATVSNGTVAAVSVGTATITATTADGGTTATCTVTVNPKTVAVTGVTLNKTAMTLTTGTSETLTATVSPSNATNKSVAWTTSDASVATVSNGTVTAVSAGTATITVTTVDGGKTASCVVTLMDPVRYCTISFAANGGSGTMADQTCQERNAFILPSCAFTAPTGEQFKAWSIDGTEYSIGSSYTITSDTTLYAVWQADSFEDFTIENGVLTKYNGSGGDVTIPNGVISIGNSAFRNCTSLTNVTIPDGVKSIGEYAFCNCRALKSVTIPNGIKIIRNSTFDGCSSLTSVSIPDSMNTIQERAFAYCTSLTSVTIPSSVTYLGGQVFSYCSGLINATILSRVDNIPFAAFRGTSLTSVAIPSSVTKIMVSAFEKCDKLKDVYYDGSEVQWNEISIRESNEPLTRATIHYIGEPPSYTVSYSANGGSGTIQSQTVAEGSSFTLPVCTFTAPAGKQFKAWSINGTEYAVGASYTVSGDITVTAVWQSAAVPMTGVSLNKTALTLNAGASETLTATISPSNATNKSITWTTSNSSVATVSNGKVTAVGAGTATITVTTADGGKTATCAVTVNPKTVAVTGVSLNKAALTLNAGASETLTATVSPSNATNKSVTWTTSNSSVATVSNGTITAVGAGTATITVTTVDGGKAAICTVTVTESAPTPSPTDPLISVGNVKGRPGGTVSVPVTIHNNPGVTSVKLAVSYDKSVLTLTGVTDGALIGTAGHNPSLTVYPYILSWENDTATADYTENGTISTLSFAVAEDAPEGEFAVSVSYDPDNAEILNHSIESVEFAVQSGAVTISHVILGDVNGDGKVNAIDRMTLSRYLAKWDGYDEDKVDLRAADVNGDGKVNTIDRMILSRHLAKWEGYSELPYRQ